MEEVDVPRRSYAPVRGFSLGRLDAAIRRTAWIVSPLACTGLVAFIVLGANGIPVPSPPSPGP
ncbi:MAG: hypothetical protein J7480_02665 [Microbacteriaceae bacterium]|nr:hypothetical protein [Microbacteriaceae bacterium]